MIVITTPTGDIGGRVLTLVLDAVVDVRVIARHPSKLPDALRGRVEIVEGSHADRAVIKHALDGASAVFWLPPGDPTESNAEAAYVEFSRAFAEALPASDVKHVVGISALGRGWPNPAGLLSASLAMNDLIGATGVSYRALCCASLMDNVLRQIVSIRAEGMFYAPTPGDLALPHVAKVDVAEVAARLLTNRDWNGVEDVPLPGPQELSHNTLAAIMTDILGKSVRFQEMPMDQFEAMMASLGASEGMARDYVVMMTAKNEGMDVITSTADRLNTPTTFHEWCEQEFTPAFIQ
ncbi:MAG: NAD(P)H-binding protein [Pseudomonadota bacterium]